MNTTTLNMTTLDGGVIIKRGEGSGSTPPSGGESASTMEYLDVSGLSDNEKKTLLLFALQVKLTGESVVLGTQIIFCGSYHTMVQMPSAVTAISIDSTMPTTKYTSDVVSEKQELTTLEEMGISVLTGNLPRLTKEQFYDLNA